MLFKAHDTKAIGAIMLSIIVIGILSISPEVDSPEFLTSAAQSAAKVTSSAIYQFIIALLYLAAAVLIYPTMMVHGPRRAMGYLCLTAIAATLIVVGCCILSMVLLFSQELARSPVQDTAMANAIGQVFKISRDFTNHGYMVLVLCIGKILLYALFYTSGFVPSVLSVAGIVAALTSLVASLLVLFQVIDVVTLEYIAMNAPTALHEIVLGVWFIVRAKPLK